MGRSRWIGALLGGLGGGAVGLGVTFYLYGADLQRVGWSPRILTMLVVGAVGALLGVISGVSRD